MHPLARSAAADGRRGTSPSPKGAGAGERWGNRTVKELTVDPYLVKR
jgi:hypothetical protein